jgi:phosphatidylserine/phosphatidylglycerophosphate/cardiolipin synthase-like enzyme
MSKLIPIIAITCSIFSCNPAHAFDSSCDVYFSPKGGITDQVVKAIDEAKTSVRVLAYGFTSVPIADALVRAKTRDLSVEVILDKSNLKAYATKVDLLGGIIPILIDRKHAIAHNKVMLIDGDKYITGSFNFTKSAETSNGENALICRSEEGYRIFEANYEKHRSHSDKPI